MSGNLELILSSEFELILSNNAELILSGDYVELILSGRLELILSGNLELILSSEFELILSNNAELILSGDYVELILSGRLELILSGNLELILSSKFELTLSDNVELILSGKLELILSGDLELILLYPMIQSKQTFPPSTQLAVLATPRHDRACFIYAVPQTSQNTSCSRRCRGWINPKSLNFSDTLSGAIGESFRENVLIKSRNQNIFEKFTLNRNLQTIPFNMMYMSMLRHWFSNERWGGGGAP